MLVLGIALAIGRSIYLNSVPNSVLPADAAAVLFDTLVRFIKDGLRTLLVVGLIVAIAAFFTGPSVTAVRARGAVNGGLGWLRSSGERAGLRTGPVGRWTYQHRHALRIGAVALFALIFVFWGRPTAAVAIVLAILLLVVLGLIELIGRPPARAALPQAAGPTAAEPCSSRRAGLASSSRRSRRPGSLAFNGRLRRNGRMILACTPGAAGLIVATDGLVGLIKKG